MGGLFGDGDTDTSGSSGSSGSGGFGGLFDDTKTDAAKGPMNLGVFLLGGGEECGDWTRKYIMYLNVY